MISATNNSQLTNTPTVIYDGHCGLCKGAVSWMKRRDKKEGLAYIARQKAVADGWSLPDDDSLLVIVKGKVYTRSAAVRQCCLHLGRPWSLFYYLGACLPVTWADWLYNGIARHRHRIGNTGHQCQLPPIS